MPIKMLTSASKTLRRAGWTCAVALVVLSWIPHEWEIRTGLAGQIEHFIAYCGTGALLAFAYQEPPRFRIALALVVLAGVLETGQAWVPGRSPQFVDFAASSLGALMGVVFGRAAFAKATKFSMR